MLSVLKPLLTRRLNLNYVKKCVFTYTSVTSKLITTYNKDKTLNKYTSVQEFYDGKSVLLTGGTGFLGKVLLEKLLYTCTNLDKVYLLVRERDGEPISRRLQGIFKNPLFHRLIERMPDKLNKVVPIAGDLIEPNLGIKAEDVKNLTEKVSVVLHTAASVKFDEPWDVNLKNNFEGTVKVLELCRQIKRIEAFVHVSTAYAFTRDVGDNVIEEKVYPAPTDVESVYNFAKKYNNDKERCKDFLGGLLNPYTYTKALAEAYVAEHHGNIPTCIVRPSIVGPKFDEPQIGWLDNWFGATCIFWNVSKGLNRVTYGNGNVVSDFIPVDYVANTCIVAAAKHDRSKNLRIYNSCSSEVNPVTLADAHKLFNEDTVRHGWNDFPFPFNVFTKSRILVATLTFLLQVLPAHLADFYLMITGKSQRYIKTMDKAVRLRNSLEYFSSNTWLIKSGNVTSLQSSLSEHDRQLFPCDAAQIDWKKFFHSYSQGVNKFLLSKKQN